MYLLVLYPNSTVPSNLMTDVPTHLNISQIICSKVWTMIDVFNNDRIGIAGRE